MADDDDKKIIIEGITESGETFRPSDWAERMSGGLSKFVKHRIVYSPLLRPAMKDGNKCVMLDKTMKETHPELNESILNFAKANKLKICGEEEEPKEESK
jgi:hypothetical protein